MSNTITPEVLADLKQPQEICISPDGKHVVYSLRSTSCHKEEHTTGSLWIAEVGKELSARQLTGGEHNDTAPRYSPKGDTLAFLSDRVKPGKGPVLYLLSLTSMGEALPLTPTENEKGVGSFVWNPDGSSIAYTSADEKTKEEKKKEEDKDDVEVWGEKIDYCRLRIVSVASKEVQTVVSGDFHVSQIAWNADGIQIAYATSVTPSMGDMTGLTNKVHVLSLGKQESELICEFGSQVSDLCWTTNELVWTGAYGEDILVSSRAVWSVSPATGGKAARKDPHGISSCPFGLHPCKQEAVVHVATQLRDQLQVLDTNELLFDEPCQILGWDVSKQDQTYSVVVAKSSAGVPSEVFSVVDGTTCKLSEHGKHIAEQGIGKAVMFEYTTDDNFLVSALYSVPSNKQAAFDSHQPQPTVVFPHGGPHYRIIDQYDQCFQFDPWLMTQGYLIMSPNYRGGAGLGNDFASLVRGDPAASYQDVIFLIQKGITAGYIDKDRVAIIGWSQGGFLSYLAVTRDSDFHFAASIPGAGVCDWDMMSMTSDLPDYEGMLSGQIPWTNKHNKPSSTQQKDNDKDTTGRQGSAIWHMQSTKITTPMLLIHGKEDVRIPVSQATAFHRAMRAQGNSCEMALYPREGHNVPWERNHYIDLLKRMAGFLKKHIG